MSSEMLTRSIPSTGEKLPVIGFGTWQGFDVRARGSSLDQRMEVLRILFNAGGTVIDSSPMYGRAEEVAGAALANLKSDVKPFLATKVWTNGLKAGIRQMENSFNLLGSDVIDLMQIHNLVDWRTHLPVLREWKEQGRIRYIGITHYTDSGLDQLCDAMEEEAFDFVQCCYAINARAAENRMLPMAADMGVAIMVNKPFGQGGLFSRIRRHPLPDWSSEIDCSSWAQFFLKYIVSHPAITCVIPGTSRIESANDNVAAGMGRMPDADLRNRMHAYWSSL